MGRTFYLANEGLRIFCMYTKNKGVVAATPPQTEHIANATYLNEGAANPENRSNIDYFLIRGDANEREIFGKDKRNLFGDELNPIIASQNPSVEQLYGVQMQIIHSYKPLTSVLRRIAFTDIYNHMLDKKVPKVQASPRLEYVDKIPFTNELIFTGHAKIDIEGKQTFYPNCVLDINLDITRWCPSGISPEGKVMPWGACSYCYASFKHSGYPYVFKVEKKVLIEQIKKARIERERKGLATRYLRLGKRTEFGFAPFREQLVNTLEACLEEGISLVFPTKYLGFDKQVASLLRRTNSTLLPSQGKNEYEKGAVMHGCDNEYRFEQGILFREAGVRVIPYILVRAHEEDGGESFGKNLRRAEKIFCRAQILPIISKNVEVAKKVLGGSYDLIGPQQQGLFGDSHGGYTIGKGRRGVPNYFHPSLEKRIGDNNGNIRICSHNDCKSQCGKCFLPNERGEIIPAEKVFLEKHSRWRRKRQRYSREATLFDMHSNKIKNT